MLTEITIACLTLMGEASICSETEMRAVARTIQVRAEDRRTSIHAECLRPYQYSCWNGYAGKHKVLRAYRGGQYHGSPAWKQAQRVAIDMYAGQLNTLPRWTHYYNPTLCKRKPVWAKKLTQTKVIGHHVFGRIN
jgi:hypothetical protein